LKKLLGQAKLENYKLVILFSEAFIFLKMNKFILSNVETIIILFVFAIVVFAFIFFYTDRNFFINYYVREDGIVEWLTVGGLLAGAVVCFKRVVDLYNEKKIIFSIATIALGILLLFGAGEEISWGQRLFHIQSPSFFQKNNAQQEINVHNLVVDGVKLNKLIFTYILGGGLIIYLFLFPYLYKRAGKFKTFIDYCGIPLAKPYQVIAVLLLFAAVALIPYNRKDEISECGFSILFFLVIYYPLNKYIFEKSTAQKNSSVHKR
jgi:hypothetical protein